MLLGCIADDFTGASDLANALARGGMRTLQFNGVPRRDAGDGCDAGIVSLQTRSIAPGQAVARSVDALGWLKAQGCRQFLFKYCSTFDSTRDGNIGPVAEALIDALGATGAIVCPAFPTLGRSIYRGHLFVGDKLLNESGLEHHPLNPMTDANLVRWLGHQAETPVGLVTIDTVMQGATAVRSAVEDAVGRGQRLVVCDCIADRDLLTLSEAVAGMPLVTGGSGIATGLPDNFRRGGLLSVADAPVAAPPGPALALAGSCSAATRAQIAEHAKSHPTLRLHVDDVLAGRIAASEPLAWILNHADGALPLVYSSAEPDSVAHVQQRYGAARVAEAMERFFGVLARDAVSRGFRRLIIAGGETSSAVVAALGVDTMRVGRQIDPGVPMLVSDGAPALALALKSGNFGAADFFARALSVFEVSAHEP